MTVTQMARMGGNSALGSWYARHPEEIGMKTGDLPPAGHVNPWAEPGMDITGMKPSDFKIIPVSKEVVQEIKDNVFEKMKTNFGMSGTSGKDLPDIIKAYYPKVAVKDRVHAAHTLTQIHRAEAIRLNDFVRSRIPGWQVGQAFDTSILDEYRQGIDMKL